MDWAAGMRVLSGGSYGDWRAWCQVHLEEKRGGPNRGGGGGMDKPGKLDEVSAPCLTSAPLSHVLELSSKAMLPAACSEVGMGWLKLIQ